MSYGCLPYVMLYEKYIYSPFVELYKAIRSWTNAPRVFNKQSFKEFTGNYFRHFELDFPDVAEKYFNLKNGSNNTKVTYTELSLF